MNSSEQIASDQFPSSFLGPVRALTSVVLLLYCTSEISRIIWRGEANILANIQAGWLTGEIGRQKKSIEDKLQKWHWSLEDKILQINTELGGNSWNGWYFVVLEKETGKIELRYRSSTGTYLVLSMAGWCDPEGLRDGAKIGEIELPEITKV